MKVIHKMELHAPIERADARRRKAPDAKWHARVSRMWRIGCDALVLTFPQSGVARLYRRAIFQKIYRKTLWGFDGIRHHCSGIGSRGLPAAVYVDAIVPIIHELWGQFGERTTIVDLGCGDFRIGKAILRRLPPLRYIGCDIVPELVSENTRLHSAENTIFLCLDIVSDSIPLGHIYLIRQVFQHLPNSDISLVLRKLRGHERVYVTESHPVIPEGPVNPDKSIGADVRFSWASGRGRGVDLSQPPFRETAEEICRAGHHGGVPREVIVTQRLLPKASTEHRASDIAGSRG